MPSNRPESPFFDDAIALERQKADIVQQLKDTYASAKEHELIGKDGVKRLKAAVKRVLKSPAERKEADNLCVSLGAYVGTELGSAAMRAAK